MQQATPERAPVFQAERVSKQFGSVVALADVDLDLYPGEIVGILGDNGAGKSTFVKIAAGVHQPSRGTIRFDGKPVRFRSAWDARRAGIEAVHQDLGLVDSMSIARNFFLGAELKRGPLLDLRRMRRETIRLLTEIGLGNLRDVGQDVSRLSGGERQAISIGRAVAFERKLLILDEPTSALSVQETEKVFEYIRMAKRNGLAVLVIMHNLVQVAAIADRFVVFWHGRKAGDFPNTGQSERELSEYILLGRPASGEPASFQHLPAAGGRAGDGTHR
ncbi:MAG TPA: ATP-binding cassette domain-containing protein [Streptosporangiaceae bacterium]|nr:ATP-binding cassette domain-containing protein [Streptosporangiaceae bacterium]